MRISNLCIVNIKRKKMKIINSFQMSFTLAEVLITLVIIGVVAAITVPTIVANSNEKALQAALKKSHSVLQQGIKRYYVDNGISMGKDTINSPSVLTNEFFLKYFNVSCVGLDCPEANNVEYRVYDNKTKATVMKYPYWLSVMLTDGTYIHYGIYNSKGIATLLVDVNGPYKKPNVQGRDTFIFEIDKNGDLVLGGSRKSNYKENTYCTKSSSYDTSGYGCTTKVLREK